MRKETRKRLGSCIFYALVLGLTLWYVFHGANLGQLWECLQLANPLWLLPAVGAVLAFILGESFIIYHLLKYLGIRPMAAHCALYSFIGFFYSAVTPSASGGQPMQLLAMRKDGIPSGVSCVVLAIITVAYKLVLVVLGLTVLVLRPDSLMRYLTEAETILYIGLVLNVICITALLLAVFYPGAIRWAAKGLLRLICRIPRFRDAEKLNARLEESLGHYDGAARVLRSSPLAFLQVFLATVVQRFCLFAVIWLTYRSFGLRGKSALLLVVLYGMISVAADMMPLPGGMGISESLFLLLFTPIFGTALVLPGMIVSRGLTYYTQLLISAVMTAAANSILKKKDEPREAEKSA